MKPNDELAALVRNLFSGNKIDVVRFVDELLRFSWAAGEIHCEPTEGDRLRFAIADGPPFEIELDCARGKARMICARLAVLCANGQLPDLYGGEGTIAVDIPADSENGDKSTEQVALQVQFDNKPGKVWFTLRGEERSAKVGRESERVRA
jgi:hypothetical protein